MIRLIQLLLLLLPLFSLAQNPFVGTWTCYKLEALARGAKVTDATLKNFKAEFVLFADSSFIQKTPEEQRKGRYEVGANWLIFYMLNNQNVWEKSFSMRWPKGQKDPDLRTPEFDFIYPELLPIINKKGKEVVGDVDVYYKRLD